MSGDPLVTVATFLHRGEAEVASASLRSAGIEAMIVADDEGGLSPGFFTEHRVRLVVHRDRSTEAALLLEEDVAGEGGE